LLNKNSQLLLKKKHLKEKLFLEEILLKEEMPNHTIKLDLKENPSKLTLLGKLL
jgi:hypothetical protein